MIAEAQAVCTKHCAELRQLRRCVSVDFDIQSWLQLWNVDQGLAIRSDIGCDVRAASGFKQRGLLSGPPLRDADVALNCVLRTPEENPRDR